jgi:kynureninase
MTATYDHDHDRDVEITVTDARGQLGKLLDTHVNDGGVVYLMRNGRRIGAVVAPDVPEKLEALEDDYWSQRAADVLAKGEPTVPWDQALALLESGNADQ